MHPRTMANPIVASRLMALAIGLGLLILLSLTDAAAQSLGGNGTLKGTVRDGSDAPAPSATLDLSNSYTGFSRQTRTGLDGSFVLTNVPPNTYRLRISLAGFQARSMEVVVRSPVPIELNIRLALASQQTSA